MNNKIEKIVLPFEREPNFSTGKVRSHKFVVRLTFESGVQFDCELWARNRSNAVVYCFDTIQGCYSDGSWWTDSAKAPPVPKFWPENEDVVMIEIKTENEVYFHSEYPKGIHEKL